MGRSRILVCGEPVGTVLSKPVKPHHDKEAPPSHPYYGRWVGLMPSLAGIYQAYSYAFKYWDVPTPGLTCAYRVVVTNEACPKLSLTT